MAWDGFAIDALGLFAEELDEGGTIGNLALGLSQWLALLSGQDRAQIILVRHHQIEPLAQNGRALFPGPLRPFFLSGFGMGNCFGHLCTAQVCHLRDHVAA